MTARGSKGLFQRASGDHCTLRGHVGRDVECVVSDLRSNIDLELKKASLSRPDWSCAATSGAETREVQPKLIKWLNLIV